MSNLPLLDSNDVQQRFQRGLRRALAKYRMPFMISIVNEYMQREDPDFHIRRTRWPSFNALCEDAAKDGIVVLRGGSGRLQVIEASVDGTPLHGGPGRGYPIPSYGRGDDYGDRRDDRRGYGDDRAGGMRGGDMHGDMHGRHRDLSEEELPRAREGDDDEYVFDLFVESIKQLASAGPGCYQLPFPASAIAEQMSRLDWNWRKKSPRWTYHFRHLCGRMQAEGHLTVATAHGDLQVVDCKYFDAQGLTLSGIRAASAVAAGVAPAPRMATQQQLNSYPSHYDDAHRRGGRMQAPRVLDEEEVLDTVWAACKNVSRRKPPPFQASLVSDELRMMQGDWSIRGTGFKSFYSIMKALEDRGVLDIRRVKHSVFIDKVYVDGRRGGHDRDRMYDRTDRDDRDDRRDYRGNGHTGRSGRDGDAMCDDRDRGATSPLQDSRSGDAAHVGDGNTTSRKSEESPDKREREVVVKREEDTGDPDGGDGSTEVGNEDGSACPGGAQGVEGVVDAPVGASADGDETRKADVKLSSDEPVKAAAADEGLGNVKTEDDVANETGGDSLVDHNADAPSSPDKAKNSSSVVTNNDSTEAQEDQGMEKSP